jgi:hypothetical protein
MRKFRSGGLMPGLVALSVALAAVLAMVVAQKLGEKEVGYPQTLASRTAEHRPPDTVPPTGASTSGPTTRSPVTASAPAGTARSTTRGKSPAGSRPRGTTPATVTTTATTATLPKVCSAPEAGPVTATFLQPCSGDSVPKWPAVRLRVPAFPQDGGMVVMVRILTHANELPTGEPYLFGGAYLRDGEVSAGIWTGNVQIGLHCIGDRTHARLEVYLLTAAGLAQARSWPPSTPVTMPAGSRRLDVVEVVRGDDRHEECQ